MRRKTIFSPIFIGLILVLGCGGSGGDVAPTEPPPPPPAPSFDPAPPQTMTAHLNDTLVVSFGLKNCSAGQIKAVTDDPQTVPWGIVFSFGKIINVSETGALYVLPSGFRPGGGLTTLKFSCATSGGIASAEIKVTPTVPIIGPIQSDSAFQPTPTSFTAYIKGTGWYSSNGIDSKGTMVNIHFDGYPDWVGWVSTAYVNPKLIAFATGRVPQHLRFANDTLNGPFVDYYIPNPPAYP